MAEAKFKKLSKSMDGKPPVFSAMDDKKVMIKLKPSKINKKLTKFWSGPLFSVSGPLTDMTGPIGSINGPSAAQFQFELDRVKKMLDWKEVKKEIIIAKQMDFNIRLSGLGKTKEGDAKNANAAQGLVNMATILKKMGLLFARCSGTVDTFGSNLSALESAYSNINGNMFHSGDRSKKRGYINRYTKFAMELRTHLSVAGAYYAGAVDDLIVKLHNDMAASGNAAIAGLNAAHAEKIIGINKKHLKEMNDANAAHRLEMETVVAKYEAVIADLKDALDRSQKLNKKYEASLSRAIGMLDKYDSGLANKERSGADTLAEESDVLEKDILKNEVAAAKAGIPMKNKTKIGLGVAAAALAVTTVVVAKVMSGDSDEAPPPKGVTDGEN